MFNTAKEMNRLYRPELGLETQNLQNAWPHEEVLVIFKPRYFACAAYLIVKVGKDTDDRVVTPQELNTTSFSSAFLLHNMVCDAAKRIMKDRFHAKSRELEDLY